MIEINTELLRKRVRESGLTQMELAKKAGVSRNTIQNIMNGRTAPSHFVTTRLGIALDLSDVDFIAIFFAKIMFRKDGSIITT